MAKVTKEEMMVAIKECAEKVGRTPTIAELANMFPAAANRHKINRTFGSFTRALRACGLERTGHGAEVPLHDLFRDWAEVVRKAGKMPSLHVYGVLGKYSYAPMIRRFRSWTQVPSGMRQYAITEELDQEYADVLKLIRAYLKEPEQGVPISRSGKDPISAGAQAPIYSSPILKGRPMYGSPTMLPAMTCGPTNEAGVIFLFALLAERLGFTVTRLQSEFPDCEALRRIGEDTWQRLRIEFEFESRTYLRHGHPIDGCDLIVCWVHNWQGCPLEVLELKSVVAAMNAAR